MNRIAWLPLVALVPISAAQAWQQYHVTCLDCDAGVSLVPVKVNASGVVVASTQNQKFSYIVDGDTRTRIPALDGTYVDTVGGINDAGVVAATSAGTWEGHVSRFGYSWDGTTFTNVGDAMNIYDDGWYSVASAINDAGQVVGRAEANDHDQEAFLYDPATGTMTEITYPGDETAATAVNSQGDVAGTALADTWHAWIWQAGVLTDLGVDFMESDAYAINDLDQVAGDVAVPLGNGNYTRYAAIWNGTQATQLGGVGRHHAYSLAYGINNAGEAVGDACNANRKCVAFFFNGRKLVDLNTRLDASSAGWVLKHAVDVNDAGQIVGTGTLDGHAQAYIATPVH